MMIKLVINHWQLVCVPGCFWGAFAGAKSAILRVSIVVVGRAPGGRLGQADRMYRRASVK